MKNKPKIDNDSVNLQDTRHEKWEDFKESFKEFWEEYSQIKYGVVGLVLLIFFTFVVILEPFITTYPGVNETWRDISYWEDLPRNAAPIWTNWFRTKKAAPHEFLKDPEVTEQEINDRMKVKTASFKYTFDAHIPPDDFYLRARAGGIVNLEMNIIRPDGEKIRLAKRSVKTSGSKDVNISASNESEFHVKEFVKKYISEEDLSLMSRRVESPFAALFYQAKESMFKKPEPLHGEYTVELKAAVMGDEAFLENIRLVAAGKVFGWLGTDNQKRDIFSALVAGTKWAMLIGLMVALVSVTIAVIYGVVSAYFGGWVDTLLMRIWEIFVSIPMIPVLIVLAAIWKPSIWTMILMMSAFYWRGSVKTIRSMALQIKEEAYIEAARALDASNLRIIFKHIIPQLIPYAFASMALRVPVAIVSEATLSLLGLGDATVVTWGQILNDAFHSGAVLQGIWWWIIPPGLAIALMGMTFAFVGFAMDTILNPKLKTR